MRTPDFDRLRDRATDCPSDLALDEFVAGELTGARLHELEAHVASCPDCAKQIDLRRAGFDAVDDVDPRALLAGIRRKLDEPREPAWRTALRRWFGDWRRAWAPIGAVGVAAAVLMVALPQPAPELTTAPDAESPSVRRKGGLVLHVFRSVDGGSEEALSGDRFHPGDRIRFAVDLPSEGRVAVVGREASGELYVAWPQGDENTLLPAGDHQELPGAVALDDAPGPETLFLVHCPPESGPPRCTSRGTENKPICPEGCRMTGFVIEKATR